MPINRSILRATVAALALCSGLAAVAADLTVSAASSLTNAFQALKPSFESSHPGTRLQLNYGASGALLQQISKGAPVDVFASADQLTMDLAQARKLVEPAGRRNFARNTLVVIVPIGSSQTPRTLGELAQATYRRIAIGQPASVPVGRYAKSVLEQAGLWTAIEPRMIGAQNVRQALDYVARGEVDAAFVYSSDAALLAGKVVVAFTVPTTTPIVYPIAPLADSNNAAAARQFVDFVLSAPAQAVLGKFGFGRP